MAAAERRGSVFEVSPWLIARAARQPTARVWTGVKRMQELHSGNVVDVNLELEDDYQPLSVHPHGEDGCRKQELADGRLSLRNRKRVSTGPIGQLAGLLALENKREMPARRDLPWY